MAKFKVGQRVQVNGMLPFTKAGRVMRPSLSYSQKEIRNPGAACNQHLRSRL
jgi:hypothetical protein